MRFTGVMKMSWVEKYRPKTLDEIVGQEHAVAILKDMAKKKDKPHLLFSGPPGVGKTTAAMAFAREVFGDEWKFHFVELNASDERGIDTVRQKIKKLAESKFPRIIFLDEADALTVDAQQALRRIMEKTKESIFILSCNYEHKIIDPIKSRCARIVFRRLTDEEIAKRLVEILVAENVSVTNMEKTKEALQVIIDYSHGDMRKAINLLEQIVSSEGVVTPEAVVKFLKPSAVKAALDAALQGDFKRAKEYIQDAYLNAGYDTQQVVYQLYNEISKISDDELQVKLTERLADLEFRLRLGGDPVIQLVGFMAYAWIAKFVKLVK